MTLNLFTSRFLTSYSPGQAVMVYGLFRNADLLHLDDAGTRRATTSKVHTAAFCLCIFGAACAYCMLGFSVRDN